MARHGGNTHNRGNMRKRGRRQQAPRGARHDAAGESRQGQPGQQSQNGHASQQNQDVLANQRDLVDRIAGAVSDQLGFAIGVEVGGGNIRLTGTADSAAARAEAEQTVAGLAPDMAIQNDLTVASDARAARRDTRANAYDDHDRRGDTQPPRATASLEADAPRNDLDDPDDLSARDPGTGEQPLETNAIDASVDDAPDLEPPVEPDPTYFAPTDPVLGQDAGGGPEVVGGFSATAMDDLDGAVDRPTTGGPGDEALADAIRRELRADALTTDLPVDVEVERGVARLRGTVPALDDTTNAEEVAGRVPGVSEVVDDLDIAPTP